MERSLIWHLSAMAASTANSTACRFSTGKAPGSPRHTGHTFVFGGLPNWVEQPQKIFVLVRSWTCTSSPMTGSYFDCVETGASGVVTIYPIIAMRQARSRTGLSVFLSACGAVEEDPGHEVLGEIHEAMKLAGGGKQHIAAFEDDLLVAAKKAAGPAYDDVNLVARMWLLGVRAARCVEFDTKGPMLEQFGEALTVRARQPSECVICS